MEKKTQEKGRRLTGDMPHSLEAEQSLLGCILLDPKIQVEISADVKEEDFYSESHKNIFSAMTEIIGQNKPVDLVTLTDLLEKKAMLVSVGGIEYISELCSIMPSSANYQYYLDIVKRNSMLRKLIEGASEIIKNSVESNDEVSALAFAEKTVFDVSETADTSSLVKISAVIPDVMAMLDDLTNENSVYRGIMTGYKDLDRILGGLRPGNLVVLAARPGCGKTSFAMNIVENLAKQGKSCAVFSLEMSKEELTQRMLCSVAEINSARMKDGKLDKKEWRKLYKAKEILQDAKIYVEESAGSNPREILSKCRRLKRKNGLDFVVIDYIQLMESDNPVRKKEGRQQEVADISRSLKVIAKELKVPVLALSQLSRDVAKRKEKPQLSDLRDSGAIEQDADIVMFIHRPDLSASEKDIEEGKVKPNVSEILVEKNRHGSQGHFDIFFKGEYTKFKTINQDGSVDGEEGYAPPASEDTIDEIKEGLGINGVATADEPSNESQEDKPIEDQMFGK